MNRLRATLFVISFSSALFAQQQNRPVVTTNSPLPAATRNTLYSTVLAATGGNGAPYTWSIAVGAGTPPPGVTLNPSTGELSGTPTAAGNFSFAVQASDTAAPPQQSDPKILSLTVNEPPLVITSSQTLQRGVVTSLYNNTLTASGGAPPYIWQVETGGTGLPPNVTLSSTGVLSGTPASAGTFTFRASVR